MKKIYMTFVLFFFGINSVFASGSKAPAINCAGLPGCVDSSITTVVEPTVPDNIAGDYIASLINILIQVVAVVAVFALIIGGMMYIVGGGNEEKTNKAKKWILWALAGVVIAGLAWGIIGFLNTIDTTI